MEEFIIKGGGDQLRIEIVEVFGFPGETSYSGGYDTRSIIEVQSDGFNVSGIIWISTGEFYQFYQQLVKSNAQISGEAYLSHMEQNLEFNVNYDVNGQVIVTGSFFKLNSLGNKLLFQFLSDQSYIQSTLRQLEAIVEKYGGMKGIK